MFELTANAVLAEFDEDILIIAFGALINDESRYYFMIPFKTEA